MWGRAFFSCNCGNRTAGVMGYASSTSLAAARVSFQVSQPLLKQGGSIHKGIISEQLHTLLHKYLRVSSTVIIKSLESGSIKQIFLKVFLIMLLQFSQFFPLYSPSALPPQPSHIPPLSSCPWVVHISSLSPLFPIPFFISPHLFYAY